jgi:hypothetical protein
MSERQRMGNRGSSRCLEAKRGRLLHQPIWRGRT